MLQAEARAQEMQRVPLGGYERGEAVPAVQVRAAKRLRHIREPAILALSAIKLFITTSHAAASSPWPALPSASQDH